MSSAGLGRLWATNDRSIDIGDPDAARAHQNKVFSLRCDLVERETGIEPATLCLEGGWVGHLVPTCSRGNFRSEIRHFGHLTQGLLSI